MLKLSALLPSFLLALMPVAAAIHSPERVESGLLSGLAGDAPVMIFKGVPFAAPPVGDLRWRAPRPPAAWQGVRKAGQFAANCMQEMKESQGPWTSEYQPHGPVSEDCLYLNVWTAANSANDKRPVLVYLPGGAFTGGSGDVPVYDGENLAKKGLVVVTINYRLGIFGFFTHPELSKESDQHSSGNYGLLDQVAALEWVKRNIAAFGGDPKRVTIMGQSAGASSVHYLLASPLAKGLFACAIADSGSNMRPGPGGGLAQSEQSGVQFAQMNGAASLAELRALPATRLMPQTGGRGPAFRPIVDGWFLPKDVDEIFAKGEQSDVPTLTGWTADEGSSGATYGKAPAEQFRSQVRQRRGTLADAFLKLYPASTEEEASVSQKAMAREQSMMETYLWAMNRAKTSKTTVYTYLFDHPQPGPDKDRYLVFHSSELPYVFDSLSHADRPWTPEDRKIAETMSAYWVNFIKTGNPNGKGLPEWPAFSPENATTMELGDKTMPRPIADQSKVDLFKQVYASNIR